MIDPLITEGVRTAITVAAILGGFAAMRRWLTKELRITKAAVFRLLKSNRTQGKALEAIAECQKNGRCNGETDSAIDAVRRDRTAIADWLRAALLGQVPVERYDPMDDE